MNSRIFATANIYTQQYLLHREFWITLLFGKTLPILVPLFAWRALYAYTDVVEFDGWTQNQMTSYYLIIFIISSFTQIDFHWHMSRMIHKGKLNEWLVRPLSILEIATGIILARITVLIIPSVIAIVLSIFFAPEILTFFTIHNLLIAALMVPLSIVMLGVLSALIGMIAFWFVQTEGTFALIMMLFEFFGGVLLPLSLLPNLLQEISYFLPLRYAIFLPAQKILESDSVSLINILLGQIGWIVFLCVIVWVLSILGLRRYEAVSA